jgi:hypothetical protein
MMTGVRPHIAPWRKGPMPAEQVERYRRAIKPLQRSLAAAKAARLEVFRWLKAGISTADA